MKPINLAFLKTSPRIQNLALFLFCFAILFGPAYALFDSYNYDTAANPDLKTYLGLANFDFNQSPIRKYRVIVPFMASGVNYVFGPLFTALAPDTFPGPDFAMCMSFLLVNCALMSVFGVLVYRLCKQYVTSQMAALTGLLSVLTCRWTLYVAGLPMVDSLYMVVTGLTLLGIKTKNTKLLIIAIFLGPWAKESFIFIAPLIFFFAPISKWRQLVLFAVSATLVFSFRYYFNTLSSGTDGIGLQNNFHHVSNAAASIKRLFSFHGVYEVFSVPAVWSLLFVFLLKKEIRMAVVQKTETTHVLFLGIVLVHALLSTELSRMFYIATPVLAIWIAVITDQMNSMKQFLLT